MESAVSADRSLTIASLQKAVQQSAKTGEWVVVIYPTPEIAARARKVLPAMLPDGSTAGGRTMLLPNGGRVSVVAGDDEPFQVESDLTVQFLEWGKASPANFKRMSLWRAISVKVLGEGAGRAA